MRNILILFVTLLVLGACGHKELKAPCGPLPYYQGGHQFAPFGYLGIANVSQQRCGEAFPVNEDLGGEQPR